MQSSSPLPNCHLLNEEIIDKTFKGINMNFMLHFDIESERTRYVHIFDKNTF